jgi:hypothetical protein
MRSRRHYLALAGSVALAGCGFTVESSTETSGSTPDGETPGEGVPTARENEGATTTAASDGRLAFSTSAFEDGGTIPTEYTGAGADRSPPLSVGSVPEAAETLAHQSLIAYTAVYMILGTALLVYRRHAVAEMLTLAGATARQAVNGAQPSEAD